jgi:proton glutamate symport protein
MWKKYQSIPLIYKMITGMVLGIIAGWIMGPGTSVFGPLGKFFLTCLKCIAMPLVIVNLIAGISNLDNPESFGRIGIRIIAYYILTSAVAMIVGFIIASIIQPGVNLPLEGTYKGVVGKLPTIGATLLALVPGNLFKAMTEGRFDQVVIVSAVMGVALLMMPEAPRKRLTTIFQDLSDLMNQLVSIIMILAPYGIFALVAQSVGKYGSAIFGTLAKYIGSVYLGILFMCCLYATLVMLFTGIKPAEFFRKASRIMVTAFSTCSSTSSIPINMECADSLGAPKKVYSFTIPLGAQINKDGTCVCLTTVFIMTAQAIGATVDVGLMLKVLVLGLILTTGSGAVPSGMLVILAILLESLGFPLEIVGIVAGVHAFNDMGMTMINCLGDLAGTVIVGNAEKNYMARKQA